MWSYEGCRAPHGGHFHCGCGPSAPAYYWPQYPGWYATVDGAETDILRAYGGLSAVVVPEGDHTVRLVYNPLSYRVGASLGVFTWLGVGLIGLFWLGRRIRANRRSSA